MVHVRASKVFGNCNEDSWLAVGPIAVRDNFFPLLGSLQASQVERAKSAVQQATTSLRITRYRPDLREQVRYPVALHCGDFQLARPIVTRPVSLFSLYAKLS